MRRSSTIDVAGLRAGGVIIEAARQKVRSVREAAAAAKTSKGNVLLLRVLNGSGTRFIAIETP